MSYPQNNLFLDLATDKARDLQPVPRMLCMILVMALHDGAERIEFSLKEPDSSDGFRIKFLGKELNYELTPAPSHLFDPLMVVLCNCTAVPYYTRGAVQTTFETKNPESRWQLDSDNLKKDVFLSRT